MYRKLTSLRWHAYLPADAGETFTITLDLFFAGPFLFAKPELAKHKNSRQTLLSGICREFFMNMPYAECPACCGDFILRFYVSLTCAYR